MSLSQVQPIHEMEEELFPALRGFMYGAGLYGGRGGARELCVLDRGHLLVRVCVRVRMCSCAHVCVRVCARSRLPQADDPLTHLLLS